MATPNFAGQTAFITGGGAGIGEAYAVALAARGAAVVLADVSFKAAEAAAARIEADGGRALAVACDVADEAQVTAAVAQAVETFGGLDILINLAGRHLMDYSVAPTDLTSQLWRELFDVNVIGLVNCARACRPHLAKRPGVMLNTASIASFAATSPYGISKLAVRALTGALAKEFSEAGIRVCGIAPGLVDSPAALEHVPDTVRRQLIDQVQLIHRPGRVSDLVDAMLFLCSDQASFVTGETLIVGGGAGLRV
jgi:NAD(P)-dependent dehydrogenase (short-subunit alcohol dehydrogenase family)